MKKFVEKSRRQFNLLLQLATTKFCCVTMFEVDGNTNTCNNAFQLPATCSNKLQQFVASITSPLRDKSWHVGKKTRKFYLVIVRTVWGRSRSCVGWWHCGRNSTWSCFLFDIIVVVIVILLSKHCTENRVLKILRKQRFFQLRTQLSSTTVSTITRNIHGASFLICFTLCTNEDRVKIKHLSSLALYRDTIFETGERPLLFL